MFRRFAQASILAATLVATSAGVAAAHECYVVDRSSTGNQATGTNSQSWIYLELPSLAGLFVENGAPELSPSQLEYFVARAQELGVPYDIALFVGGRPKTGGFTIGDGAAAYETNGKNADGHGVDHFFDAQLDAASQAYMEALDQPQG